ncbi:DUF2079 domain-containing protein [Streptomyces sp. TS71-3]|uniref:DUF2079 domain-containing protein n=1 Tax=Streptomyces sp. TS71-3 TaxID=2733862 RepID=UPI001B151C2C|nr:DUF2079 domain-containing protein [Streptomyces sp. TS71-3]GHJ35489.1 hypothetical protein Sm713_10980 [Streptomyces sp. TS71-3]
MLLFALYGSLSLRLHLRMLTTGYDLGIFEQAVRSYAHGHLPVAELKGPDFPLLGDHFSPVVALLAPVYRLWPTPVTLLLAQAGLLALAVVPLGRFAQHSLGRRAAVVLAFGYGTSWGIAQTVGFDFHEVAFAVPLLAFSLAALGEGRWRAAAAWALPLLTVKEDLGLSVAAIGAVIAWRGPRRLGLGLAASGLLGSALEILVVIPAFNQTGSYTYWGKMETPPGGTGLGDLLDRVTLGLITPEPKATMLVMLLAPTAFFALRSALMPVGVPTLAWRLLSDNPAFWGTGYHYSAVLMPIVFFAFADALRRSEPRTRYHALMTCSVVSVLLVPQYPLGQLLHGDTWRTGPRVTEARRILAGIPDGASVAASNRLAPQLTSHDQVTVFGYPNNRPFPQWVVVDTATPQGWPITPVQERNLINQTREEGYRTVIDREGYLLLRRTR